MSTTSIPDHLDWFTANILPDGAQELVLRALPPSPADQPLHLDKSQSQILSQILFCIAQDPTIPWSATRAAVLRGFWKALRVNS